MVSCQSSHSMTSCPQQIAVPFAVCIFGGFGEMPWRPSPPKIQGCRIDQQIQRWLKDQLQDSIANKGMAWPSQYFLPDRHSLICRRNRRTLKREIKEKERSRKDYHNTVLLACSYQQPRLIVLLIAMYSLFVI